MGKKKKRKKSEFRGFVDWRSMLILKKKRKNAMIMKLDGT